MEKFSINGQLVKVNVDLTRKLYKPLPLISEKEHCGCDDCVLYTNLIVKVDAAIYQFFEQFGIDPRKEAEVWRAGDNDDGSHYYIADYHFIGEIQEVPELDWVVIGDASFGLTNRTENLPSPMIPETFTPPIIQLMVKVNLRSDV